MALDVHCTYIKQVQVAERQDKGKQHNDNLRGREAPRIYWIFLSWATFRVCSCRYFLGPGQKVPQILALGLSSRKNLCVHPSVAGKLLTLVSQPCLLYRTFCMYCCDGKRTLWHMLCPILQPCVQPCNHPSLQSFLCGCKHCRLPDWHFSFDLCRGRLQGECGCKMPPLDSYLGAGAACVRPGH